ncbi:MAG: FG-GAP-like repeat-containing protein, partial [Bacteroidales bacterium]
MTKIYKHLLFMLFLSTGTGNLWAQIVPQIDKTWILNTNQSSTSRNYVARESIKLQANGTTSNFSFKAVDGKSFSAKIDAGLLFPPTSNTYKDINGIITSNPAQGAVVGSIPGTASVTPTGAATYQIPIDIPAGINGMQPSVSVVYNSQGGFGTLGMGWELSAVSAISRTPQNLYFDKVNGKVETNSIQFNDKDRLSIDGQRLIYISGGTGSWTSGAIYATEVENYAQVVFNGTGFTVTNAEGKLMEYGINADSRLTNANDGNDTRVLSWKLNKVTDPWGNTIIYTYSDNGQYLQKIEFAGQSVEFSYDYSPSYARKSFITNFLVSQSKLLSSITTKSGTTIQKKLDFYYYSMTDCRLFSIGLTIGTNSQVNNTIINWGTEISQPQFSQIGTITDTGLSIQPEGRSSIDFADINGDGYPDRIERWNGDNDGHIKVYFYDSVNKTFANAQTASINNINFHDFDTYHQQFLYSDINKDGKAEIIYTDWGNLYVYKYNNTSNSFTGCFSNTNEGVNTDGEIGEYYNGKIVKMIPTDVNHDGYTDIMLAFYNKGGNLNFQSNGRKGYTVYYGGSNGLNPTPDYDWGNPDLGACTHFEVGDFNADGKIDLLGIPDLNQSSGVVLDDNNVTIASSDKWNLNDMSGTKDQVLDINGDGLSDLIAYREGNYKWRSSTNSGGIFNQPVLKNEDAFSNESSSANVQFIDINGDGFVDVLKYENIYDEIRVDNPSYDPNNGEWDAPDPYCYEYIYNHTKWSFYKNTGGVFASTPTTFTTTTEVLAQNLHTIADINGDGIADLVWTQGTNVYAISMTNVNNQNRVASITNGMGLNTAFTYNLISNAKPYDPTEDNATIRSLRAPLLVVDKQTDPDGSETSYTFENPKIHTEGKGFLGFSKVTAVNTAKNAKIVSEYGIEPTYYGVNLIKQTISNANDVLVSKSKQYNDVKVIDAAKKRYIPIVKAQWSFDKLRNTVQKITTDYSAYPNTTKVTTVKDSTTNIVALTTTAVTTYTAPPGVAPYLPATVNTTRTQGTESDTHSVNYNYTWDTYNKYKLMASTETVDPDKGYYKVVNENSNPDTYGHLRNVTVKAKDQYGVEQSRGSSMTYTSSGKYIASKTNNLGVTTTYNWNETLGLLNYETTIIGGKSRTTSYTYDNKGDLIETLYPDGNRKTSVLQWAGSGEPVGGVYYSYSQNSGQEPVLVYYDYLGREIQKESYGLNNKKIIVNTEYYTTGIDKGKVFRVSEPHFEGDSYNWAATNSYNPTYGYLEDVLTPLGTAHTALNNLTTTVTTPDGTNITTTNAAGQTLNTSKNGKTVNFAYYASGLVKSSTPEGGQPITMAYNPQGKRIKLIDPDAGFTRNEYNAWGELTKEVQKIHLNQDSIVTSNVYKADGRLESINRNGEITTYTYDISNKSRVNSIAIAGKHTQTFGFDNLDRVTSVTEDISANNVTKSLTSRKVYDELGRIKKEIFPSGYYTVNSYDNYSNLIETKDLNGKSIWKANTENALGQATSIFKGTKESTYSYNPTNHQIASIQAAGIIDYSYHYYPDNNLEWRSDNLNPQNIQREDFNYDAQKRLTNWNVTRNGQTTNNLMSYDDVSGNITGKTDIGFSLYYGGKNPNGTTTGRADNSPIGPHALSSIGGVPAGFSASDLAVSYTDFKKIATLKEGNKGYKLTYGVDDQRRVSKYSIGTDTLLTRYYVGNYEEEVFPDGKVRKIHYLSGAILIQTTGVADSLYYSYADAQGSLIALVSDSPSGVGGIIQRFAYDPWGARRDPNNWTQKDTRISFIINRGYTGHEHLDAFGIINMNGRVYDPATASFFSADPVLTDAGNWLDYNRYGYCLGNPFRYTDPSGYNWWDENWKPIITTAASIVATVAVSALTLGSATAPTASMLITAGLAGGAAGGFVGGALGTAFNGGSLGDILGAGLKGAIIGGISGAITAGIGSAFGTVGVGAAFNPLNEVARAGAHALAQGAFAVVRGGNFWQGAAAGLVSS